MEHNTHEIEGPPAGGSAPGTKLDEEIEKSSIDAVGGHDFRPSTLADAPADAQPSVVGDPLRLGTVNSVNEQTFLFSNGGFALITGNGSLDVSTDSGVGVSGHSLSGHAGVRGHQGPYDFEAKEPTAGVWGESAAGDGAVGTSKTGNGVWGVSDSGRGVRGETVSGRAGVYGTRGKVSAFKTKAAVLGDTATSIGVAGTTDSNIAVLGQTTSGPVAVKGVKGKESGLGVSDAAVLGDAAAALGVVGASKTATGVLGRSDSNTGVKGESNTGTAVAAVANGPGDALAVVGRATFSRSGVLAIPAGSASGVVMVDGLVPGSLALAMLQTSTADCFVRAAVPEPAVGRITVELNVAAPADLKVGWFVVN